MGSQRQKMGCLCLLLVVSGGWMTWAARPTDQTTRPLQETVRAATPPSASDLLWQDPNSLAGAPGGLGNGELFFKMMLSVGLVIGLGAAALYLSKRVLPKVTHASGQEIHILETAYLGPRKTLHLVEVGGHRLLLASTSDRITMLAPVPEAWPDLTRQELGEAVKT